MNIKNISINRPFWGTLLTAGVLALGTGAGHCGQVAHDRSVAIEIPSELALQAVTRQRVADSLENPRGMLFDGNTLLVALAGEGQEDDGGSGSLVRLSDDDGDGSFERRRILLADQLSKNILHIVRRDEVFGLAEIARGGGETLVSAAFFGGPSQIYKVDGTEVSPWATVDGNINSMTYDEKRESWIAISSSSEQVLRISPDGPAEELLVIPDLPEGQDPVPGYVRYEPETGQVLVSLFSGSPLGEENGDGTEIVHGAGGVIRVDPDSGNFEWVVSGLTAPTDLLVDKQGRIYVLEFCADFLDPVKTRQEMWSSAGHGGFKRFSGRLLRIDPSDKSVTLLADDLDGPTNLHLNGDSLFIAQGMGTPGRLIPGPGDTVPLDGFIDRITLDP